MNLSSSFKTKLNVSKAHIIANEIKEEDESESESPPVDLTQPVVRERRRTSSLKNLNNSERRRSSNSKSILKKQQLINETDLDESSCSSEPQNRPRVDRFLSIVEIPPEIIWLTQQTFAKNNASNKNESIEEEEEEEDEEVTEQKVELSKKSKLKRKKKKKIISKRKESLFNKYGDVSTLSQQAKANIIKEIIKNYDLDLFINETRSKDVVQIHLNKKYSINYIIFNK